MKKCILSITLSLVILISFVNVNVYADEEEETTEYTINLIYNDQNIPMESYQTIDNYNSYYDLLSGNFKDDVVFIGYSEDQYNVNQFDGFYNSINYYGNNEYLDFSELTFNAIKVDNNVIPFNDCIYFISLEHDTSNMYLKLYLLYSPTQSGIYICGGQICSENAFYVSCHSYYMFNNLVGDKYYSSYREISKTSSLSGDTYISVEPAPDGILHLYHTYNFGQIILSSNAIYYTWNGENDTDNNDLYNYGYSSPWYIFWHLKENDDTTGFLTDRRIYVGSNPGDIDTDPIDWTLFDGVLGFDSYLPKSSVNSDESNANPFTYINYKLNNYTRLKPPEEVLVKFNVTFQFSYTLTNGLYQKIVFNDIIDYPLSDAPDQLYISYNFLNNVNPQFTHNFRSEGLLDKLNDAFFKNGRFINYVGYNEIKFYRVIRNFYEFKDLYDRDQSQGEENIVPDYRFKEIVLRFNVDFWLEDTVTGEVSKKANIVFDMLNESQTYTDDIIEDDDDDYYDFIKDHEFTVDDDMPVIYVPDQPIVVNPGQYYGDDSAHASIGNITIGSTVAELIVDMSEEEWLQHSPTFNNMMEAVKQGYLDTAEDSGSMLDLIRSTYDIFPPEVWKYLLTAIGVISSLAVIRYIRRG